jgi:UDP-N-acetylmuramoylalanine--D-glutamate ligase
MKNWKDFFKGKRVTLMGLGLLGRGLGDAIFLAEQGAELIVTDLHDEKTLGPSLAKLKKYKNIEYVLGKHRLEDFRNRDFIVKAAGVHLDSPYILEAQKNGIPIEMDASLFAKLMPKGVTLVGVTGTRGKSTVTALIYEILSAATRDTLHATRSVYKGGNLVPEATLPLLEKVKSGDIVVLELDSWQLQGFHDAKISPQVAVFTTFLDDHLIYYKNDRKQYFADKTAIFRYQKAGDVLIAGEEVMKLLSARSDLKSGKRSDLERRGFVVTKKEDVPENWNIPLLGEHNLENIACAVAVAKHLKIPEKTIQEVVENFKPVPGRLEFLREVRGVKIYNDNNATTPDATLAALRALARNPKSQAPRLRRSGFGGQANSKQISKSQNLQISKLDKHIVLICGGTDKGLDMSKLVEAIPKYCKAVVLLKETGTEKLLVTYNAKRVTSDKESKALHATCYMLQNAPAYELDTLHDCADMALRLAKRGDTVLFSPAFASFGKWFKNEYDRGNQFVELTQRL